MLQGTGTSVVQYFIVEPLLNPYESLMSYIIVFICSG